MHFNTLRERDGWKEKKMRRSYSTCLSCDSVDMSKRPETSLHRVSPLFSTRHSRFEKSSFEKVHECVWVRREWVEKTNQTSQVEVHGWRERKWTWKLSDCSQSINYNYLHMHTTLRRRKRETSKKKVLIISHQSANLLLPAPTTSCCVVWLSRKGVCSLLPCLAGSARTRYVLIGNIERKCESVSFHALLSLFSTRLLSLCRWLYLFFSIKKSSRMGFHGKICNHCALTQWIRNKWRIIEVAAAAAASSRFMSIIKKKEKRKMQVQRARSSSEKRFMRFLFYGTRWLNAY